MINLRSSDWLRAVMLDQSESSIYIFEFYSGFGSFPPKKYLSVATSFGRAKDYDLTDLLIHSHHLLKDGMDVF